MSSSPVIIDAVRTPIGTEHGSLKNVTVDQLVTPLIAELAARCPEPAAISQVILGNLRGPGGNLARYCALDAGLQWRNRRTDGSSTIWPATARWTPGCPSR